MTESGSTDSHVCFEGSTILEDDASAVRGDPSWSHSLHDLEFPLEDERMEAFIVGHGSSSELVRTAERKKREGKGRTGQRFRRDFQQTLPFTSYDSQV